MSKAAILISAFAQALLISATSAQSTSLACSDIFRNKGMDEDLTSIAKIISERTRLSPGGVDKAQVALVVGLGNIGYDTTRHNVGADIVSRIAKNNRGADLDVAEHWLTYHAKDEADALDYLDFSSGSSPWREDLAVHFRVGGRFSLTSADSKTSQLIFLQPHFDINESGHVVAALARKANLQPEQIIVIVDDLTLAKGQIVLSVGKPDGLGDAHNGLKSINAQLGNGSYFRIRVGISNPKAEKLDVSRTDWVLGKLTDTEQRNLFSVERLEGILELVSAIQSRSQSDMKAREKTNQLLNQIIKKLNSL
jgi:peptidyl-tRNA hydrolase